MPHTVVEPVAGNAQVRTARAPGLRILHLLAPAWVGGLEEVVAALAGLQAGAGHEVHVGLVLEPETADHPLRARLESGGVQVYALVLPPRTYRRERQMVRELCTSLRPDVVHTHGTRSDVLHSPVARRLGIPTVSTSHGFCGGDWKNRLYERLQRRAQRACRGVVAVSRPMAEQYRALGFTGEQLHCIPNAWADEVSFQPRAEARRVLGIAPGAFCIGFVGRLGEEKGPDILLEALARTEPRVSAAFIGEGRMQPLLEERAHALGLGERVLWKGVVPGAAALIRAFDVIAISSRTEGTPVVLLEAMAAGVPVVASRVGGIPFVVSEDEAFLVPAGDSQALAAAIGEVRHEPEAAGARAVRARERLLRERDATAWREQYDRVYQMCGAGAAGSPLVR